MKQDPKKSYLYLPWPVYLAQFYAFECYRAHSDDFDSGYKYDTTRSVFELEPVVSIKGSAERDMLRHNLTTQPKNYVDIPTDEATICIQVPCFPNMPPAYYNYLSPQSDELLRELIRSRVRLDLYSYVTRFWQGKGGPVTLDNLIYAWMENHGIEDRSDNFEAVKQLYSRQRNKYHMYNIRMKNHE